MASKSQDVRLKIILACSGCEECNCATKKNRRNTPDRPELAKLRPCCRRPTAHHKTR